MAAYKGKSKAIRVGGVSGTAAERFNAHGWRLSVPGTQVVDTIAFMEFSTDAIADTDGFWTVADPTHVSVPTALCGVYNLAADGFTTGDNADFFSFEIVVDQGNGEDPALYQDTVAPLIHTRTPKSHSNPLSGFYKLRENARVRVRVTNSDESPKTLLKGSFTGLLAFPADDCSDVPKSTQTTNAYGATHQWPLDEASGAAAFDVIGNSDGTVAVTGSNPIRRAATISSIPSAAGFVMNRADTNGDVTIALDDNGAGLVAGNGDWSYSWWSGWVTPFLGAETVLQYGGLLVLFASGSGENYPSIDVGFPGVTWSNSPGYAPPIGQPSGPIYWGLDAPDGNLHFYTITYSGTTHRFTFYRNGVVVDYKTANLDLTVAVPSAPGLANILVFNNLETFKYALPTYYPVTLSAAQIANLARGDSATVPPSTGSSGGPPPPPITTDPPPPPFDPGPPIDTSGFHGSAGGDTKNNTRVGPTPNHLVAYKIRATRSSNMLGARFSQRWGPGYSLGTGGSSCKVSLQADVAGVPSGVDLASTTFVPGNPGVATAFDRKVFGTPAAVTPGHYWIVFENLDVDPDNNYFSVNNLYLYALQDIAPPVPPPSTARPFPAPVTTQTFVIPGSIDPTGATDVSALINAWVASKPDGSILDFNGGTFKLSEGIQMAFRHHLVLWGHGATLIVAAGSSAANQLSSLIILGHTYGGSWSLGSTNIAIHDFHLIGNDGSPGTFTSGQEAQANLEMTGVTNLEIYNVTGQAAPGDFIFFEDVTNVWVHDVHGITAGRNGVSIISGTNILVERSAFDTCGYVTFDVEPNTSAQASVNVTFQDCTAITFGNLFFAAEGTHTGALIHAITVQRCHITGKALLTLVDNGGAARMTNFVFKDNVSPISHAGPVVTFRHIDGLTISGNSQPLSSGSFASISPDCTSVVNL